jgi:16S rRNA (guanine1207-N2)-methyltransferase
MTSDSTDPVSDTLFLPFEQDVLPLPARAVFLRARDSAAARRHRSWLACEQSFKPDADALVKAGFQLAGEHERFAMALVLLPRQRDESRALLARAATLLEPGGRIIASAANNEGARSGESDLEQLTGQVSALSKHKCRVFWSAPLAAPTPLQEAWRQLDAVRPIVNGRFQSRPGVFAWDRIDPASALLAAHLPVSLAGHAADLGCGFGYLSVELLNRCSRITHLHAYEAEQRALDLARMNLAPFEARLKVEYRWHDVTAGLPNFYDVIVTNPPFHTQSRADRPDIGQRFIRAAAHALKPGGSLWLVANRHLPYENELGRNFGAVRIVAQEHGFKIVHATKSI